MTRIRAFVGHSFSEEDAVVVGKFLKYLKQLSDSHTNFSWENAESAEPMVIGEKVMGLFAGKDLFIGICTKKERVIAPNALTGSFLRRNRLSAREEDFEWKTSDWIIQEIGLAIGLGIKVMLLAEEGLRSPGDLQGDLECLKFERDAPEKIFGQIFEMISALTPKVVTAILGEPESISSLPEEKDATQMPEGADWKIPKQDWARGDYEFALKHFVALGDEVGVKTIRDQYLKTESGAQAQNMKAWDAYMEYLYLVFGKNGSLSRLTKLANESPGSSEIFTYLARIYDQYEEFGKVAATYEKAAGLARDISDKLRLLGKAACAHQEAGNEAGAVAVVVRMKAMSADAGEGEAEVLQAERKLADISSVRLNEGVNR